MTGYVLGFLFDLAGQTVLLVKKLTPIKHAGKWNGVGGKIQIGEGTFDAMRREAAEELVGIGDINWHLVETTLAFDGERLFIFAGTCVTLDKVTLNEKAAGEIAQIAVFPVDELPTASLADVPKFIHGALIYLFENCNGAS